MNDVWMKIKAWTKAIAIGVVFIYAVLFVYNNSGKEVDFWYWFKHTHETTVFFLSVFAFFAGVIVTLLVRTLWSTVHQIRQARVQGRLEKLERENAEQRAKAATLQTRPLGEGTVVVDRLGQ